MLRAVGKADLFELGHCQIGRHLPVHAFDVDRCFHDVSENRHVREEVEVLEHHAGAGPECCKRLGLGVLDGFSELEHGFANTDATGVGDDEEVYAAQQSGLSGTRRAKQCNHAAVFDLKMDILENL